MATKIEWTDESWNPVTGCDPISDGCKHCYAKPTAESLKRRRVPGYQHEDPFAVRNQPSQIHKPAHWKAPRRIFVRSMSDLFHKDVNDAWIDQIYHMIASQERHTFQVLTKRPERMLEYVTYPLTMRIGYQMCKPFPLSNLWIGVTAENQATADERIPYLLKTPAVVRFLSIEPMLEEIDIEEYVRKSTVTHMCASVEGMLRNKSFDCLQHDDGKSMSRCEAENELYRLHSKGIRVVPFGKGCEGFSSETGCPGHANTTVDWVIVGCESGNNRRPCKIQWVENIVDQVRRGRSDNDPNRTRIFIKQVNINGKVVKDWNDPLFPEHLKIREFPNEN